MVRPFYTVHFYKNSNLFENMIFRYVLYINIIRTLDLLSEPCDSSPCENGGTCTNNGDSFSCECAKGFEGETCSGTKINPKITTALPMFNLVFRRIQREVEKIRYHECHLHIRKYL